MEKYSFICLYCGKLFKDFKSGKFCNSFLQLRYGKRKLQRLRYRSFPYVGNAVKLSQLSDSELIRELKKVLGRDFGVFFRNSISKPTVEEVMDGLKNKKNN